MTRFADTYYYLALLNPKDAMHTTAIRRSTELRGQVVTTEWIITELADGLAQLSTRSAFLRLLAAVQRDPGTIIVPVSEDLQRRGLELYRARPDKEWSLTDCISFVVMNDRGIVDALTGDHHFEQAGFTALLKPQ